MTFLCNFEWHYDINDIVNDIMNNINDKRPFPWHDQS